MSIPSSVTQVLVTLVLVVPGFIFQGVRIRLRGRTPGDNEITTRIISAIALSTVFALVYVVVLGSLVAEPQVLQDGAVHRPRRYALLGLAAAFVIPATAAFLYTLVDKSGWWIKLKGKILSGRLTNVDPRPSAWDAAFSDIQEGFVRVRTTEKTWYAGWFGGSSYASSWPDPPNLFVELAYTIDANGVIGEPVTDSTGAYIDCANAEYIEFVSSPDQVGSGTIDLEEVRP